MSPNLLFLMSAILKLVEQLDWQEELEFSFFFLTSSFLHHRYFLLQKKKIMPTCYEIQMHVTL